MKKLVMLFGLMASLSSLQAATSGVQWHTDLAKAQAIAKAEKKMVLLDFTGSDW